MIKPGTAAFCLSVWALLAVSTASAQDKPAEKKEEVKSPWAFTGNMTFASEYRYRGISQTNGKAALQGGFDLAHSDGFYAGTWASNVNWLSDQNVSNSLEWDFYGGYKGAVGDFAYDVGGLYYYYPGTYPSSFTNPNTFEIYGAVTWKQFVAKYSHALTDIFGFTDSKGAGYLDLSGTFDLGGGLNLVAHIGQQMIKGTNQTGRSRSDCSYADWKVGVTYDYVGLTWGAAYVDTNAKGGVGQCYRNGYDKNLGKSTLVISATKTF